ncbi:ABC transporter type 1, transmembrane domain-containing protein [Endogone sp. FLAS-F59071]|nr:ABC transporter type 1, transmembrane domain-containing protein [Endogone sp. FLAS-F59071]|eukprot:RUS16303.1 ABC transporter type 1, transmembrane domain-containing protein [Endogone sp. FLAS-F59071]
MKIPLDNHYWTNAIRSGDPDPTTNISPCILDSAVFALLALYMGLVIVHGWWKRWKASSSHESHIINLLETRLQSYPPSLQPLASTIQGLVLLICFTCFFFFLYLVVLYHTDPDAIGLPFRLLLYSALLPLAWFLNFFVLSAERRRNRIYTHGTQGFWFLALAISQFELYNRIITYTTFHPNENVRLDFADTVLFTIFLIRYFFTWILVFVALFLAHKVRKSIERRAYDALDTEAGEENFDDASVDHHHRHFKRRTTTPATLSEEDDLENGTTGTTPSTTSDETLRTLLFKGLPKSYGTLPRRWRRAVPAQTSAPQSFTSSPHTNYLSKLRRLAPFMWPRGDRYLQALIIFCLLLLAAERIVNVLLPISYKHVVDALAKESGGRVVWKEILIFVGLRMLQGGVGFIATAQKGLWVPIGQFTTRELQLRMFEHLLNLSLRFHLNRKTGEILRVQDRGVSSIVTLLTTICFNIIPTLTDVAVACVYFTYAFDAWFGAIVLTTMTSYVLCTMRMTEWRMGYRRETNRLENEMEAKAG